MCAAAYVYVFPAGYQVYCNWAKSLWGEAPSAVYGKVAEMSPAPLKPPTPPPKPPALNPPPPDPPMDDKEDKEELVTLPARDFAVQLP